MFHETTELRFDEEEPDGCEDDADDFSPVLRYPIRYGVWGEMGRHM